VANFICQLINLFNDSSSFKADLRVFTLTHFGAKASYIYNPPLDKNELAEQLQRSNYGSAVVELAIDMVLAPLDKATYKFWLFMLVTSMIKL